MASVAMPGLFPPQVVRGIQVVDSGITDNVPVDVAAAEGAVLREWAGPRTRG